MGTRMGAQVKWWTRLLGAMMMIGLLAGPLSTGCALFGGDEAFEFPISTTQSFTVPVDTTSIPGAGTGVPAPADIPLPLGDIPVNLAEADPEIDANKDKLKSIVIDQIVVTPQNNTLSNGSLPAIELAIGPPEGASGEVIPIATIPAISGASTGEIQAQIDVDGMNRAQTYITGLNFTLVPSAIIKQGDQIPGGGVDLKLDLKITAVVDPTR